MKRRIIGAVILTVFAIFVNVVWFSSVFDVRSVRVFGTHFTTKSQVLQAAGIRVGQPIARVDVRGATERVGALPQVVSVDVRRGFPHSIVIEVHERIPIAAAANADGGWSLVDRTGALFQVVSSRPERLTAVEGYTERFRGIGARTAAAFPDWLRARVKVVRVLAPADIRLELRNGHQVVWGGEERAARKAQVLQSLLKVKARYFDVSAPDTPATRK